MLAGESEAAKKGSRGLESSGVNDQRITRGMGSYDVGKAYYGLHWI